MAPGGDSSKPLWKVALLSPQRTDEEWGLKRGSFPCSMSCRECMVELVPGRHLGCALWPLCAHWPLNDTPTSGPLHGVWGPSPHAPGQPGQAELSPDPPDALSLLCSTRKLIGISFGDLNPFPLRQIRNRRAYHLEKVRLELTELEAIREDFLRERDTSPDKGELVSDEEEDT